MSHYHVRQGEQLGDPYGSRAEADTGLREQLGRQAADAVNVGQAVTVDLVGRDYVLRFRDDYLHGERAFQIIECQAEHEGAPR